MLKERFIFYALINLFKVLSITSLIFCYFYILLRLVIQQSFLRIVVRYTFILGVCRQILAFLRYIKFCFDQILIDRADSSQLTVQNFKSVCQNLIENFLIDAIHRMFEVFGSHLVENTFLKSLTSEVMVQNTGTTSLVRFIFIQNLVQDFFEANNHFASQIAYTFILSLFEIIHKLQNFRLIIMDGCQFFRVLYLSLNQKINLSHWVTLFEHLHVL